MTTAEPADSALRRRTRGAIVDAAVRVWARDFAASLSAVADEAGVSRSTVHRYFADKPALVDACLRAADEAFGCLQPTSPTAAPMDRLVAEIEQVLPLGHWVLFLWADPSRFAGHPDGAEFFGDEGTEPTRELIRQGQAGGDLDPDAPVEWLLGIYYAVLYSAAECVVLGTLSIAEASRLAARSLRRGISAG